MKFQRFPELFTIFLANHQLLLSGNRMICIKTDIPQEICDIDDELKAIYHSKETVCIWIFKTREDRNRFMDETAGMPKEDREKYYESFYD